MGLPILADFQDTPVSLHILDVQVHFRHDSQGKKIRLELLVQGVTLVGVVIHKECIETDVLILEHEVLLA
jgi:hypothetical protein